MFRQCTAKKKVTDEIKTQYYIKLTFMYQARAVNQPVGETTVVLLQQAKTVTQLPAGIIPNEYNLMKKRLETNSVGRTSLYTEYYHDCGVIDEWSSIKALYFFNNHYEKFKPGFPAVAVTGPECEENEIIRNLVTAVKLAKNEYPSPCPPLISRAPWYFSSIDQFVNSRDELISNYPAP